MPTYPEWTRKYIGLPAQQYGRGPSHFDCYGLIKHAYEIDKGIDLPSFGAAADEFVAAAEAQIERERSEWLEIPPGEEQEFDLILTYKVFKHGKNYILRPLHLGLVAQPGTMLHAEGRIGTCLENYRENPIWAKRVAGFFRHKSLAESEHPYKAADPFTRHTIVASAGTTVNQILDELSLNGSIELEFVHVTKENGEVVRGEYWDTPLSAGTRLTISLVPQGAGGMRIGMQVGLIGLAVAATALTGNPAAGMAVMTLGTLAMGAFFPVAVNKPSKVNAPSPAYSISGTRNALRPGSPVPVLFGKFRCLPPMAGWYTASISNQRYFYGIYEISAGLITDPVLRIGDTHIDKYSGVEVILDRGWHPTQLISRGGWNPRNGWPLSPQFGWTWTASSAGSVPNTKTSFNFGDTITFNDLYPRTDARAWDVNQNKPRANWPDSIQEENVGATLPYGTEGVTRTSKLNADELWINIGIDQLGRITGQGKFDDHFINFDILEAPVEKPDLKRSAGTMRVTGKTQDAVFTGHRWKVAGNSPTGQYDVTVRRLTPSSSGGDSQILGTATWLNIKTITHNDPVSMKGYARLFVSIRSSGQLTGILDKLSVEAQRIGPTWENNTWKWKPSSSPATAYRLLLQTHTWSDRLPDASISLTALQNWVPFCTKYKCEFNAYIDFSTTRDKLLSDICRAGFAVWTKEVGTGKMSLAVDPVDQQNPVPVRYFSNANSWNSSWSFITDPVPDAIRITFADAAQGHAVQTFEVYNDGKNDKNSQVFRDQQYLGVTSREQITLHARMELGDAALRRMTHVRTVGPEYLACQIGDVVGLADDTLSVGLGRSGRIQDLIFAPSAGVASDEVIGCLLDQKIEMVAGQNYALAISGENANVVPILTDTREGGTNSVKFAESLPEFAIAADDTWTLGLADRVVVPVMVRDIRPDSRDGSAEITFIALPPYIETIKKDIPEYKSFATLPRALPVPIVDGVLSDATVMQLTMKGDLVARVVFRLRPIDYTGYTVTVMYRLSGTDHEWAVAQTSALSTGQVAVTGVSEGSTYDFILFYESSEYLTSPAARFRGHKVVGRTGAPQPLNNLMLSVLSGNQVQARWDEITEMDVRAGGGILVRHSTATEGASWAASISLLAQPLAGTTTQTTLPYLPGTYLFRVQDSSGLWGDIRSATLLDHSVNPYTTILQVRENPNFTGTKQNLTVTGGQLRITRTGFNAIPNVNAIPVFNDGGSTVQGLGLYSFANVIDLGAVKNIRLRRRMIGFNDLLNDSFIARTGKLSTWESWSGVTGSPGDCWVEVRYSALDPAVNPWSAWTRIEVTELTTRYLDGRARVFTRDGAYTFAITELGFDIDELVTA